MESVWSALQSLPAIAVLSGLLCPAAFAATRTGSLLVSATVVSGCQVSPALSAAEGAASAPNGWSVPVSVTCSLPVSYQVEVSSNSSLELAGLGSPSPAAAGLQGYGRARDLDSLPTPDQPTKAAAGTEQGAAGLLSPGLPPGSVDIANGPADGPDPGAITVTIVY